MPAPVLVRGSPCIACIGLLGRRDQPLYIATFPVLPTFPPRQDTDYHWHLLSATDALRARAADLVTHGDLYASETREPGEWGLLFAVDERLAYYAYTSATSVRFIVGVDMQGRKLDERVSQEAVASNAAVLFNHSKANPGASPHGIREADLLPVFRALHRAYAGLLRNPFFDPDACDPGTSAAQDADRSGQIECAWFSRVVHRIGEQWSPTISGS